MSQALSDSWTARLVSMRRVADDGLSPRLSPDGAWVGFSGPKLRGIQLVPSAGGEVREVTSELGVGYKFAWSPDAAELAYVTREEDGSRRLRVLPREGGEPMTLWSVGPGEALPFPHYAKDGALLFVAGDRIRRRGETEPVTGSIPSPRFVARADDSGLIVGGDVGVYALKPATGVPRLLAEGRRFFDPVASADGALVLVRELGSGGSDLWAIEVASGKRTLLGHYERGCVLPKSGLVVAELNEDDGLRITRSELWAMRPDGTQARKLEGPPGAMPHRVDCAAQLDRLAFTDENTGSVWVADVEVQP